MSKQQFGWEEVGIQWIYLMMSKDVHWPKFQTCLK